ncbi:MAG: hypothetical protein U0L49_03625 [Eubacterium sp.]|nr:hypothetical protein [Eubacterium sp.]
MKSNLMKLLEDRFPLTQAGKEPVTFAASGMNFTAAGYQSKGLGHVSVMEAEGMGGQMRMTSLIINPFEKNAPLLSCDSVIAMGTETWMIEMFNTMLEPASDAASDAPNAAAADASDCTVQDSFDTAALEAVREKYADLEDVQSGDHWYDSLRFGMPVMKKGKESDMHLAELAEEYLQAYLESCKNTPDCDSVRKKEKAKVYSEGLLEHGGPATDPVKAALGEEKTGELFRKVLFGTE